MRRIRTRAHSSSEAAATAAAHTRRHQRCTLVAAAQPTSHTHGRAVSGALLCVRDMGVLGYASGWGEGGASGWRAFYARNVFHAIALEDDEIGLAKMRWGLLYGYTTVIRISVCVCVSFGGWLGGCNGTGRLGKPKQ